MAMMALMLVFLHGNGNYDFDDGTITSMMSMTKMTIMTTMTTMTTMKTMKTMTTAFSGGGCMGRCLRMQMLHPAQCNSLC